jgi:hypothetical protein
LCRSKRRAARIGNTGKASPRAGRLGWAGKRIRSRPSRCDGRRNEEGPDKLCVYSCMYSGEVHTLIPNALELESYPLPNVSELCLKEPMILFSRMSVLPQGHRPELHAEFISQQTKRRSHPRPVCYPLRDNGRKLKQVYIMRQNMQTLAIIPPRSQ